MRGFLIVLAACGGTSAPVGPSRPSSAPAVTARTKPAPAPRVVADPISVLAAARVEAGWIVPAPAQLVLGGTSLQPASSEPIEVDVLEERGADVRVGVRLDHVRFALWTERSRMLAVLAIDQHIGGSPSTAHVRDGAPFVMLRAGARVQMLEKQPPLARVRYHGAFELEGWISLAALRDRGPAGRRAGRRHVGRKSLLIQPGATIRTERRLGARPLAVSSYSQFVDSIAVLDNAWQEVRYSDNDVDVRGFLSTRDPPSRLRRLREPSSPSALATNATVAAGTCLHAADEPIGFVVGDRPAYLRPTTRVGWFEVTLDSPWGPITFEARGPTETSLATCGPSPDATP